MNLSVILEQNQKTKGSRWREKKKGGRKRCNNVWKEGRNYPSVAWINSVWPISAPSPHATDCRAQARCWQDAQNYSRPHVDFGHDCEHGGGILTTAGGKAWHKSHASPRTGLSIMFFWTKPSPGMSSSLPWHFQWQGFLGWSSMGWMWQTLSLSQHPVQSPESANDPTACAAI